MKGVFILSDKTIMRVVKNKDNPYVLMNKEFLSVDEMSWKAKGILSYLLSKPDNWKVIIADLVKKSKDGRDAVYAGIKELISFGYIEKITERDSRGRVEQIVYLVYESPLTENPETVKPETAKPPLLNNKPKLNNKYNKRTFKNSEEREYNPTELEKFLLDKSKNDLL